MKKLTEKEIEAKRLKSMTYGYCCIDANGDICEGSLGSHDPEQLQKSFPDCEVHPIYCPTPEGFRAQDYILLQNKLIKKKKSDRWSLEIVGPSELRRDKTHTFSIQKVDEDGVAILEGSEEIVVRITRGILDKDIVTLAKGFGSFELTPVQETVSCFIVLMSESREINASKEVRFVNAPTA